MKRRFNRIAEKPRTIITLFNQQAGKCAYCGEQMTLTDHYNSQTHATKDHVFPRSKGGRNDLSNLVACHRSCNEEKSNILLRYYLDAITGGNAQSHPMFNWGQDDDTRFRRKLQLANWPTRGTVLTQDISPDSYGARNSYAGWDEYCKDAGERNAGRLGKPHPRTECCA
jgi:hypothetical protein